MFGVKGRPYASSRHKLYRSSQIYYMLGYWAGISADGETAKK